jgi:hypothetical protein
VNDDNWMQWVLIAMGFLQLFQAGVLVVAGVAWRSIWAEMAYLRRKQDVIGRDLNRLLGRVGLAESGGK